MFSIEFDPDANAMYIRLKRGKIKKSEQVANNVIVDVNKKGEAIGVEILLP